MSQDHNVRKALRRVVDAAVDEALRLIASGALRSLPRQQTLGRGDDADYFRLEMPALLAGPADQPWLEAVKVIEEAGDRDASGARRLGSRLAWLELWHRASGAAWRLEAADLTDARTGSAAVWAVRHLLGERVRSLALLGTGRVAAAVVQSAARLLPGVAVRVASRDPARCEAFARHWGAATGLALTAVAPADWVGEAVAAIAAVPAPTPCFDTTNTTTLAVAVAVEGDPRPHLVAPELLARGPVVVDSVEQAVASGSFRRAGAVAQALVDNRELLTADLAAGAEPPLAQPVIVLQTGLAAVDLWVAWRLWQELGGAPQQEDPVLP
ncbi:MAG: hypothetical protein IT204_12760 [Fimbriimonadaceae bacterium]|nr:hypothetical protein [Fimbriimonadaceae bacterium]